MNILVIMALAGVVLLLGGRFYSRVISRVLGEKPNRATPATTMNDGRDYVPTRTPVVFAHHYASIAGGGPIIGPVLGILYGWGPVLIWLIFGSVFLGAVHDFVITHIAMREGGKNLTVIARRYIGRGAFVMLLILLIALLTLVCAAFLDLSGQALISRVAYSELGLTSGQTIFPVTTAVNESTGVMEPHALIGGIAFTSVIVITLCAPVMGFLYLKRQWPVWICSLIAVLICAASVWIGLIWPVAVDTSTWKIGVSIYVLIAAGLPVWLFLQSRDFINVHILYLGIIFLLVAVVAAAIRGGGAIAQASAIPFSNWTAASKTLGPGWPTLFVIISCGAVSGFHSLCAGGTTCKQLNNEKAARQVGYYAMLLESFLAVCVVCSLLVGLSMIGYQGYCYPGPGKGGNPVLTFAMAVGHTVNIGLNIPVAAGALGAMLLLEGFLVTTLDTAIRLTRYMIEEGWATIFGNYDIFAAPVKKQAQPVLTEAEAEKITDFEVVGTGGLGIQEPPDYENAPLPEQAIIKATGLTRVFLRFLKYYWVNSGIAVTLMLLLVWGNGYQRLWNIFGASNQLLAALALLVATAWLIKRSRPIWYTLLPAVIMLVTSLTMLVRLLVTKYIPGWPSMAPLVFTDIIVIIMTAGITIMFCQRWRQQSKEATAAGTPAAKTAAVLSDKS